MTQTPVVSDLLLTLRKDLSDLTVRVTELAVRHDMLIKAITDISKEMRTLSDRIRVLEQRPVVTPRAMWGAIGVILMGLTVMSGIAGVIVDIVK
jgi:hypothetical protein